MCFRLLIDFELKLQNTQGYVVLSDKLYWKAISGYADGHRERQVKVLNGFSMKVVALKG